MWADNNGNRLAMSKAFVVQINNSAVKSLALAGFDINPLY